MNTVEDRFWDKVDRSDNCWMWTAHKLKTGYGQFWFNDKIQLAHRVSWTLIKGKIPKEMFVLHKCDNPSCVNPLHLFLGAHTDNMKDMVQKGRCKSGKHHAKKTHCPQGHPYEGDNLYINPAGSRVCRNCHAARVRAAYCRRKENL